MCDLQTDFRQFHQQLFCPVCQRSGASAQLIARGRQLLYQLRAEALGKEIQNIPLLCSFRPALLSVYDFLNRILLFNGTVYHPSYVAFPFCEYTKTPDSGFVSFLTIKEPIIFCILFGILIGCIFWFNFTVGKKRTTPIFYKRILKLLNKAQFNVVSYFYCIFY